MSYINFDKRQLANLEYSLNKELLRANQTGSYSCTTLVFCNTRKYHGLLISPIENIDNENHILLSAIDETIEQHGEQFNLGLHQFEGKIFSPKGHKYLRKCTFARTPKITYNVGGVLFSKDSVHSSDTDSLIVKYTLEDAHSETKLIIKPFLAFRSIHALCKANDDVNKSFDPIENGIRTRMYDAYPHLYMQLSKAPNYQHVPDWYYNVEYQKELDRGYDALEDLYVPGTFEIEIKKGESVYFAVGLEEIKNPKTSLKKMFDAEMKNRIARDSYEGCLQNAARQFFVKNNSGTNIIAGYPWFGIRSRDTFIALPGLTLSVGDEKLCKEILDGMIPHLNNGWFPRKPFVNEKTYTGIDTQLWFFWALQQYAYQTKTQAKIWKEYGETMQSILNMYKNGSHFNVHMLPNGLIYGGDEQHPLTWMNACPEGIAVTPRNGFAVEVNALWYNAVMFAIEVAKLAKDTKFVKQWEPLMLDFPAVFKDCFWDKERGYLADVVNDDRKDFSVRPNQVIATALPYSPVSEKVSQLILDKVRQELLTPRGLRTLSPKNPHYKPTYQGNAFQRDMAYHQGTVWVWQLQFFVQGYLNVYGDCMLEFVENLYHEFEKTISEHGVGSIAEVYDGDPPHQPRGAISQAWSVASLLKINQIIETYKATK